MLARLTLFLLCLKALPLGDPWTRRDTRELQSWAILTAGQCSLVGRLEEPPLRGTTTNGSPLGNVESRCEIPHPQSLKGHKQPRLDL